jgi:hypothetical protein
MINSRRSHTLLALVAAVAFIGVGVYGYSRGVISESQKNAYKQAPVNTNQVLGVIISDDYVNPFTGDSNVYFGYPIEQLRGCRNLSECTKLCSQPENFQRCSAWNKSL